MKTSPHLLAGVVQMGAGLPAVLTGLMTESLTFTLVGLALAMTGFTLAAAGAVTLKRVPARVSESR